MEVNGLLVAYIRILGVAALIVYGYSWVARTIDRSLLKRAAIGLLFGTGGVISMHDPVVMMPGLIYDARSILLILSPLYGGPIGMIVAALMMIAHRLMIGGIGAMGGSVSILVVAGTGYLFTLMPRSWLGAGWRRSLLLGLATVSSFVVLAFLPPPVAIELFQKAALPVMLANVAGVMLLSDLFHREKERVRILRALENEASVDPLTKLPNRRFFQRAADRCAEEAGSKRIPFSVIMIDIDYFKKINDTWGHSVGDSVLSKVANTIRAAIRKTDIAARYGGEEIVILLPYTRRQDALNVAEKIRRQVEAGNIVVDGQEIKVTVSLGIASADADAPDFQAALKDADTALYRAKAAGRNRCEMSAAA
ncbi:diguanylate cyclase [Rhizobium bangladeshense]|uniref:GGDEF domain-containing protein n=1 Tax=Rhizobium bangladeshense TaxID=1138189 RepID=UPI001C837EB2|nr:diguanylate cyclase [Rhizobium bangladeshense]MBX4887654.1 diguanylate cyclase [Rhizobium bangladeshense]